MAESRSTTASSARSRRSSWCSRRCVAQRTIVQLCREHDISEGLLRKWRHSFRRRAPSAFQAAEHAEAAETAPAGHRLQRALGADDEDGRSAGSSCGMRINMRVAVPATRRARRPPALRRRVAGSPNSDAAGPAAEGPQHRSTASTAVFDVRRSCQQRRPMVAALGARAAAVDPQRVQRLVRAPLLQPCRSGPRRRSHFSLARPMSSGIWT